MELFDIMGETSKSDKERFAWNNNLVKRDNYTQFFSHSSFYVTQMENKIQSFFEKLNDKVLLEIGSNAWIDYIHKYNIKPSKVICLNISITELNLGLQYLKAHKVDFPVEFIICDGNTLPFNTNIFDGVFGGAILHHLDFSKALQEVNRVCKPHGNILFHEPLGINPVGKAIRLLTPNARTEDEKPLDFQDLKTLNKYFHVNGYYSQLFSVFSEPLTRYIFKNSNNLINRLFFVLDEAFKKLLPPSKYFFREILIIGKKKNLKG